MAGIGNSSRRKASEPDRVGRIRGPDQGNTVTAIDGAESDTGEPCEPRTELGIEDAGRVQSHFAQAREVLACGMQDPFLVADHLVEFRERTDRRRIEQEDPRTSTEDLDQVRPL